MLPSGTELNRRWLRAAALAGFIAMLATAFAPAASAVTYEPEPSFCEPETVHDYLAAFERMPKLHEPSASGQIGFGPTQLRLRAEPTLVVGGGALGFTLFLKQQRAIYLPWTVTTTLVEVNGNGRPTGDPQRLVRRVVRVQPSGGGDLLFEGPAGPAFYRVTIVFSGASGRKLGKFSSYYRVVSPAIHAKLGLNADVYRPESTVFGRVENFGTDTALYGVPYVIERREGETWATAPESPKGPWILPLLFTAPGLSGRCNSFWIPPSMPAGIYRMKKVALFAYADSTVKHKGLHRPPHRRFLTGEFEVSP